jgi:hypothetical protein
LERALDSLEKARADVYTFAFCHEHSRDAVCVYADSAESSDRVIRALNRASMKRFVKAVKERDLDEAAMWQASAGRNLSLRDFAWKKLGRRSLGTFASAPELHEAMLLATMKAAPKIAKLSSAPADLLFTCSTANEEVGLVWSVPTK